MIVFVNGKKIVSNLKTLFDICLEISDNPEAVATAINGEFIPKALRKTTHIQDGDTIEIIAPLEGG